MVFRVNILNQSLAPNPVLSIRSVGSRYHRRGGGFFARGQMDRPTTKEVAYFFNHVQITKSCWLWTGALVKGYGQFSYRQKQVRAHRFSYELFVELIESGKYILHRRECGNRLCVNPHHLYMGTHADNMRDMRIWGNNQIGEANPPAKLSDKDVMLIRKYHKDKGYKNKDIAKMFNISQTQISRIINEHNWKHI